MPTATPTLRRKIKRRFSRCPIDCPMYLDTVIESLSDFFAVFHSLLDPGKMFWFRGHSKRDYTLAPSALRYSDIDRRNKALGLVVEMKRFLEMKLPRPPTRLLDWTQNAAVALFFACCSNHDSDGLVAILNPIELNQTVDPRMPRVFNYEKDAAIIAPYFGLDGKVSRRGKNSIAINPTWNTERIAMQQGAFTLHGT